MENFMGFSTVLWFFSSFTLTSFVGVGCVMRDIRRDLVAIRRIDSITIHTLVATKLNYSPFKIHSKINKNKR